MAFQQYLAEEVAIDHADGLYSRREALRRLGLLGVGVPAASALLAACGGDGEPVASTTTGAGQAATPPTPAVETEEIGFPGPEGRTVRGAWAAADQPRGAVLVIHENRGLNDHIRSVAGRLAADGYPALAIDLLSAEGGTAALGGEAEAMAALSSAPQERFVADMKAGLERAGLTHEIVTYQGAGHAFFNDTGPRYNQAAATRAYAKVLDWFGRHLA
jgi:carboxymethylenebutenolidase